MQDQAGVVEPILGLVKMGVRAITSAMEVERCCQTFAID